VMHDGLLASIEDGQVRAATFDDLYPAEIRERVIAAESNSPRPNSDRRSS